MIVIGATAPSLKDVFAVPSSRFETDSKNLLISGAEIHAIELISYFHYKIIQHLK